MLRLEVLNYESESIFPCHSRWHCHLICKYTCKVVCSATYEEHQSVGMKSLKHDQHALKTDQHFHFHFHLLVSYTQKVTRKRLKNCENESLTQCQWHLTLLLNIENLKNKDRVYVTCSLTISRTFHGRRRLVAAADSYHRCSSQTHMMIYSSWLVALAEIENEIELQTQNSHVKFAEIVSFISTISSLLAA